MKIYKKYSANLSLVIASHQGKNILTNLFKSIIKGSVFPKEIIIVSTDSNDINILKKYKNELNIRHYVSDIKNQVQQRSMGFQKVKYDFILQLDDDVILKENTIKILYENISKKFSKRLIAATIYNNDSYPADIRWTSNYNKYALFRLVVFILNNFKKVYPNTILCSGRPIPEFSNEIKNNEWLNSCLCFHKSALKDYEVFNLKGKSFYEDIFTTHNFYKKGYKLDKIKEAIVIHPITHEMNFLIAY